MGCVCAHLQDTNDSRIETYMDTAERKDDKIVKMLLLGAGSTGKTTLFKALQVSHRGGTMKEESRKEHIDLIRLNMLDGLRTLVEQSNILYQRDNGKYQECQMIIDEKTQKQIDTIAEHTSSDPNDINRALFNSNDLTESQLNDLFDCAQSLWSLPCIKATYKHRGNNFAISDNLTHFLDNISNIVKPDFIPNEEDCLLNRIQTTGMIRYEYKTATAKDKIFRMLDVGGQRTERRKWMNWLDNVQGLLFVASLVDYNCVLYEDSTVNSMLESVRLYSDMISRPCFSDCAIVLLLNKNDLLIDLLSEEDNGLARCFSKEGRWPDADEYWDPQRDAALAAAGRDPAAFDEFHTAVIEFIATLFLHRSVGLGGQREVFCHTTVATECNVVGKVFEDIQLTLVHSNVQELGFLASGADDATAAAAVAQMAEVRSSTTSPRGGRQGKADEETILPPTDGQDASQDDGDGDGDSALPVVP